MYLAGFGYVFTRRPGCSATTLFVVSQVKINLQRPCRLARLVELLRPVDAQPPGPRGVAGVQR
jgi:hypothetical protein